MTARLKLYPFQEELVRDLVAERSILIGDDMGLGKTIEAIAIDQARRKERFARTLIVCPSSVVAVWSEHLNTYTSVPVIALDPKKREDFLQKLAQTNNGYFVVHWEAVRLLIKDKRFQDTLWFHIVADESHRMKNRKAQQTRALKRLKTYYRTAMSGTPADNHPHDLWSQLNWLKPTVYTSYWKFYDRYLEWEIAYPSGYRKIKGIKNSSELLKELAPFYRRRLKEKVLQDLPGKYYQRIPINLGRDQRKAYNEMRLDMIAWVEQKKAENKGVLTPLMAQATVAQLVRLQQLAVAYPGEIEVVRRKHKLKEPRRNRQTDELITHEWQEHTVVHLTDPSAKIDAVMEILGDAGNDKQFVIFSQFKQAVYLLETRLKTANISFVSLTGDTKQTDRGALVEAFQLGKARVFIGTIAAGGVGITLTAASTVIFIDRAWSPSLNKQAEDRLHRIGQPEAVQVIDLVARDTVDLGRHQRIGQKWNWIEQILGDKVPSATLLQDLETSAPESFSV